MYRLSGHEVRVEGLNVPVSNVREVIIGEGRVEMPAFAIHTLAHCTRKRGLRPAADPGLRVRRDVRAIDCAELRGYS